MLLVAALGAGPAGAYDWLQFNGDAAHSGNNTAETALNAGNVGQLTQKYHVSLPGTVDGAPVFLQGVSTAGGVKDLLFVTTTAGHIVALDAATGTQVWSHQYGPNGCIGSNGSTCFTTSSPAIDPNRQYVYSYGLDGNVHKYQVGDGAEIQTGGWPQLTTLKGDTEKGSSALATATIAGGTSYLYVAHGGYPGDAGDYQGHLTVIDLATGAQKVFNAMCSAQTVHFTKTTPDCTGRQTAIWARPGVIYDAGTNRIFFGTGNGGYDGAGYWSESVLAINPDGSGASGKPIDSFTPATHQALDNSDADLGSTAPAILPVPANSNVQHLALQGGKDQLVRLINLANLSGQGGPGHIGGEVQAPFGVPSGGGMLTQPAVWINPTDGSTWAFAVTWNGINAFKLAIDANGNPSLAPLWHTGAGGSSPLVANNIVYYVSGGVVRALDPTNGALLWTSPSVGSTHWQSPVVANGVLFVTSSTGLTAFALSTSAPTFTSANTATFTVGVQQSFTVKAAGTPTPTLSEIGSVTPPNGITFSAGAGLLSGTPGPSTAGVYGLQFKATNGVLPDATQNFTLIVNATAPSPGMLIFSDPLCPSFVMSGTPPQQTLTCAGGGSGGGGAVPACNLTATPPRPAAAQPTTITANCTNQPTGYLWSGGKCTGVTASSCTVTKSLPGFSTFSVTATNAAGSGAPASITVTWQ